MTAIAELDGMARADFVAALSGIFEHSPWVAEAVADCRPFGSLDVLHGAMVAAVAAAGAERQLALLRAHPELAGGLARAGGLGAASSAEQAGLGLDRLEGDEADRFAAANAAYGERFGFPFIIAVRGQKDRAAILAAMERRLGHDRPTEIAAALAEVGKIARFRLEALTGAAAAAGRLTTHVLDTTLGRPAAGIGFALYRLDGGARLPVAEGATNADGRAARGALLEGAALSAGTYELVFEAGAYLRAAGQGEAFYDAIPIRFVIADPAQHYHVPLILARYGYSTYRGS